MARFSVLSRVDAFVDYVAEVEADSPEEAVNLVYDGDVEVKWRNGASPNSRGRHVVALDDEDNEIESTARGDFQ